MAQPQPPRPRSDSPEIEARDARGANIILRHTWSRVIFFGTLILLTIIGIIAYIG